MIGLGALADVIRPERVIGIPAGEVTGLAYDSRQVGPGTLFFAMPGEHADGHDFVRAAVTAGAVAVVVERDVEAAVPQLVVARSRDALADAADAWFGQPSERLRTIGVTGTDGKTTTGFLAAAVLDAAGRRPGLIGTVEMRIGDERVPNELRATTPEALELQELLFRMVAAGNQTAVIEATSHGLAQSRVRNCRFRVGIVTNLTHEHLDFHGTVEAYRDAKAMLVAEAPIAILNRDDAHFAHFRSRAAARVISYGTTNEADVRASGIDARPDGTAFDAQVGAWTGRVKLALPGWFNVYNALACLALADAEGVDLDVAARALREVRAIPGRMERIDQGQPFAVIVDYAHTPDSLDKVLRILRPMTERRLAVVFGSAGERDVAKRPFMGRIAAELADIVIVTDEDPRLEDRDAINKAIADGARAAGALDGANLWVIADRRDAIRHAVGLLREGDVLLLAGKGHEGSIFYGTEKAWWDEREVARQELRAAGWAA
ncbi:MAG: UDP-N-acetylmuramoyl-L-alanyl-D-glutamate--2,6-diaminopimelate ligase [Candidatus Limnocylindria bacterium]